MSPRVHLNELQIFVLAWVRDGCPEGVFDPDDHSHKISARALASRGLVTVRRPNGKWRAAITDAGRHYLEHGQFPVREDHPKAAPRTRKTIPRVPAKPTSKKPSPTEELVARVVVAGGDLALESSDDTTRIDLLIAAAHRFGKTPPGTRLRRFAYQGGHVHLLRLPGWTPEHEQPIPVPDHLRSPHPAVRELRERGLHAVTKSQVPRVLRLFNALAKTATARGWTVTARQRNDWVRRGEEPDGPLQMAFGDTRLGVRVTSISKQIPVTNDPWRRVETVRTDRLRLALLTTRGVVATWSDTDAATVEQTLHDVLLHAATQRAADEVAAVYLAEERRLQAIREAEAEQRRRKELEERERADRLGQQVRAWLHAQQIRDYAHALSKTAADNPDGQAWADWALAYADRIDPVNGQPWLPQSEGWQWRNRATRQGQGVAWY